MTDDDADRARDLVRRGREIRTDAGVPIGAMADQAEVSKVHPQPVGARPPGGRAGRPGPARWGQASRGRRAGRARRHQRARVKR